MYCFWFCIQIYSYNCRELGVYCAKQLLSNHLDPTSPTVQYGFFTKHQPQDGYIRTAAGSGNVPNILQMKSISLELPGGLHYFRSRIAKIPDETVPMITKEQSVGSVCLVRVRYFESAFAHKIAHFAWIIDG